MRIPSAYFSGLGRKPDMIPNAPEAVLPSDRGAQEIAEAGMRIGQGLARIGSDEIDLQGRQELGQAMERRRLAEQQLREQEAEAKRLEQQKQHGAAQTALFEHENVLADVAGTIAKTNMSPTEKLQQFDEQAQNVRESFNGQVPAQYQYAFGPSYDQQRLRMRDGLVKSIQTQERDVIRGQLTDAMEALKRTSQPLGVKLELVADLEWEKAGYSPAEQATLTQQFREGVTSDAVAARFNEAGPKTVLDELTARTAENGPYSNYTHLEPKQREAYIQTARHQLEAERNRAEQARREQARARKDDARDAYELYKDAKEGLLPLGVKEEAALLRRMAGTDYLDRAKAVQKKTTSIGYSLEKIQSDPLTFGAAQLGLNVTPLDPRTAGDWPQQLAERGKVAGQIRTRYGLAFLPILTNQEAKGLTEIMKSQSPQGVVTSLETLAKIPGMKGATMKQLAGQFAQTDTGLGMVAGLVASGRSEAATHVAMGQRILKEKGLPSGATSLPKDMGTRFNVLLGGALNHSPQNRQALEQAVNSAYLSLAATNGKLGIDLDVDTYNQAFQVVAGEKAKINSKEVLIPSGMSEGTFKDFFKRTSAETITAAGGVRGFTEATEAADAIRSKGKLYEAGDGRYRVAIDGRYLQTTDGRDFLLSIGSHW